MQWVLNYAGCCLALIALGFLAGFCGMFSVAEVGSVSGFEVSLMVRATEKMP